MTEAPVLLGLEVVELGLLRWPCCTRPVGEEKTKTKKRTKTKTGRRKK
jgi:hypothetical protein